MTVMILGWLLMIVSLVALWYFIKTIAIMAKDSVLIAILAFFFSPIVHIVWYLSKRQTLSPKQKSSFRRLFISFMVMTLVSLLFFYFYYQVNTTSFIPLAT